MTIDRLKGLMENKQRFLPIMLLGVAVFSGAAAVAKVTGHFMAVRKAENIVVQAIAHSKSDPNAAETQVAKAKPLTDELKQNNLFSPPPPKENPVKDVLGIFGSEAFINGKWYKTGDSIADAKVVAIGPTSVTIEWDGKKTEFYPIQAKVADASKPTRGPTPSGGPGGEVARSSGPEVTVQIQGASPQGGRMGFMGGDFGAMRDRFRNMSQQEREQFFRDMRARREQMGGGFGGRGGSGGRSRGGRR
jgi:hypothetical protein